MLDGHPGSFKQMEASASQFVSHMQSGKWFSTWHFFPGAHENWVHGFWHNDEMHAMFGGHSTSALHPPTPRPGQVSSPKTLITSLFLHWQVAWWLAATHLSFPSQIEVCPQGDLHSPFSQYKADGQSLFVPHSRPSIVGLVEHLLSRLHPKWGLPVKHSGHSHLGLWFTTRQRALTPQAARSEHGLMHSPRFRLHDLSFVQSLSDVHEADVSENFRFSVKEVFLFYVHIVDMATYVRLYKMYIVRNIVISTNLFLHKLKLQSIKCNNFTVF